MHNNEFYALRAERHAEFKLRIRALFRELAVKRYNERLAKSSIFDMNDPADRKILSDYFKS